MDIRGSWRAEYRRMESREMEGRRRESRFIALAAAGLAVVVGCCGCGEERTVQLQRTGTAMGTVIQQSIYTSDAESPIREEIEAALEALETEELSWRLSTSEIYAVNAGAGEESGTVLSAKLAETIERCMEVSEASEGAFDITLGQVVRLWNLDSWAAGEESGVYVVPTDSALQAALESSGNGKLILKKSEQRLILPEGMALDLGAVGKGIALDRLRECLRADDKVTGAIISVGGSILTYGQKPDGEAWRVGIVNPQDTSDYIGVLSLTGEWCVSTSGDYERYVEVDGIRYHHILNPSTGYPADSEIAGVTVLARDGFMSDALSTACFILGSQKGMQLAESYGAEVLFVEHDGSVRMTEGMREIFTKINP